MTTSMPGQVPGVQPDELPADTALLDVREDDEWAAGHAPNAVHIPMGELPERLSEIPEADQLYVVCRGGGRSSRATAYLNANGWDAVNVERGMNGWAATGHPMVADDPDTEPSVL